MLHVMNAPSHGYSVPLSPTGRCRRLYRSKNSYDCQLWLLWEKSGSFFCQQLGWILCQTVFKFSLVFCDAVQVQRETCSVLGGKIKWDSFRKEWDNSRSLFNCSLVHVLIIFSTKWETLKTDKSTTNYVLWSPEAGHTDCPCWVLFHLNLWIWVLLSFFSCSENEYGGLQSTLKHYRTESRTTYSWDNRPQTGYFVSAVQLW